MSPERNGWIIDRVPVALLAGGLATRLRPLTEKIPKALVEVAGRPFIEHQLALLHRNGIRQVVLCLGHLGEQVQRYLGDGSRYGLDLRYSYDGERMLGTGGALLKAAPILGEVFWVICGDSYMDINYRAVLDGFRNSTAPALMVVIANHNRWERSNVVFQEGRLLSYDKHRPTPNMTHVDYGASLLRRHVVEMIPVGKFHDLADLYHELVNRGQMIGYDVSQRFFEIGSFAGLEEAQVHLRRAG